MILAQLIVEVLGRPADYISQGLNELITNMSKEKGVAIKEKTLHEPALAKDSKDIYTTFADLLIEFDSLGDYLHIVFAYMPSHVELITPEKISLTNYDINDLANKITQRLHNYDAIAKQMLVEKDFLMEKLKQSAPDVFKEITTPPDQRKNIEVKEKEIEEKIENKIDKKNNKKSKKK